MSDRSHLNNFDLIRLFAAGQVAITHGVEHIGLRLPFHDTTLAALNAFPGVPIFFFISGYLIASSYIRQSLPDFTRARALRIFPALWVCLLVSIASVWASGYFATHGIPIPTFAAWIASQATIVQFYNPGFLREYGVGALNGSLWTIPVELQFYMLAPFVVILLRKRRALFWAALGALVCVNFAVTHMPNGGLRKLASVTFMPWIYMFMLGAACQLYWSRISHWFEGRAAWWAIAYALVVVIEVRLGIGASTNNILAPFALVLVGLILASAYTGRSLANRILAKNDISYGLYIYHMPVYNYMLYKGFDLGWWGVVIATVLAFGSWKLVEKPALRRKKSGRSAVSDGNLAKA